MLLALVAFRYVISDRTPEISYSTLMDYYMLFSFFFALAIIASQTLAKLGLDFAFLGYDFEMRRWVINGTRSASHPLALSLYLSTT